MTPHSVFRRLRSLASIPRGNPGLLTAQFDAFRHQMPLMYLMLIANSWALVITHYRCAPAWLVVHVPIAFTGFSAWRAWQWARSNRVRPSLAVAERALARTNRLAVAMAVGFTAWALSLARYGDAYAQAHVAFYMAITVIGVIFSLMHLRPAAITVAIIVNGAFFVFFLLSENIVFRAIAVNTALVSAAMLVFLLNHYRDFTRMVDARAENERLANLDSLTGLPNRRSFFHELDATCAAAVASQSALAVGIIDLDGFKPVNDIHGHAIGDKVLEQIGERLALLISPRLRLARLGGDEFGLLVSEFRCSDDLLALGERVCRVLREPVVAGDVAVQISGSIGFAMYPDHCSTAVQLYEFADYALYAGKRNRRGSVVIFSAAHDAAIRRASLIEQALQMADLERELSVVFQPLIYIATGRVFGFEALARWSHPVLGNVAPDHFIPVAERIGVISALTRVLLRKALATASRWPHPVRLAFNLSTLDLASRETMSELLGLIRDSGFDPSRLDFEITETALAREIELVQEAAARLRALGCGVSLDDFGVGYSSRRICIRCRSRRSRSTAASCAGWTRSAPATRS
nr:EAL domain-containing protein [Paraburkholderia sp. MMS20-SJTR3]